MSHHLRQWLFSVLRKLVLDNAFKFIRRSIRGLLVLYAILRRQFRGRRPPDKGSGDSGTPTPHTISSGLPYTDASGACTCASVITGHTQQQQPGHNRSLGFADDSIISPSYEPGSSHPHLIPGSNAQDPGAAPVEAYALHNVSTHHLSSASPPSEDPLRGPSPDPSDVRAAPLRASPIPSLDLAIPAGQIPRISRPALSSAHPMIFPIAPMAFERYERNVVMHVHPFVIT
jgi:hypothetical protein